MEYPPAIHLQNKPIGLEPQKDLVAIHQGQHKALQKQHANQQRYSLRVTERAGNCTEQEIGDITKINDSLQHVDRDRIRSNDHP